MFASTVRGHMMPKKEVQDQLATSHTGFLMVLRILDIHNCLIVAAIRPNMLCSDQTRHTLENLFTGLVSVHIAGLGHDSSDL